jgi:hypothetical protein
VVVLFNGGGDSGDNALSVLVIFLGLNPSDKEFFPSLIS